MFKGLSATVLLASSVLVACAPQAERAESTTQADTQAINQVREQEVAATSAGDTVLAYLSDDILMMPPNEPAVAGLEAVRSWFRNFLSQFTVAVTYTRADITVAGDWAIERYAGTVTLTPVAGGAAMEESIKGLHIYHRQADGSWKMTHDIWNSDAPAPTAE